MALAESTGFLAHPGRIHTWFRVLSIASVLSIFSLIVLGGVVRVTESGLGCPDWPLCHGNLLPPLETTAIIEYTHRLVASALVGPLVLATAAVAWLAYRRERWIVAPASLAVVMLLVQGALGGVTVVNELPGEIVTAHLALAEALLACMLLVLVVSYRGPLALTFHSLSNPGRTRTERFPLLIIAAAVAVYLLLLSGSIVTATEATRACSGWPFCYGNEAFPAQFRLSMIHMSHRFVAGIVGLFLLYVLHLGFRVKGRPDIRYLSMAGAVLFMAQIISGAANIWGNFSSSLVGLHLGLSTAVWGVVATLAILSFIPRNGSETALTSGAFPGSPFPGSLP